MVRYNAVVKLANYGNIALPLLVDASIDKSPLVRDRACHELGELKDARAVKPLLKVLRDEQDYVGREAAKALIKIGNDGIESLITCLKGKDYKIKKRALYSLINYAIDPRLIDHLIDVLDDDDPKLRACAAWGLRKYGEIKKAGDALALAINDKDKNVRINAADSLGNFKDYHPSNALINALKDEDFEVRIAAVKSVGLQKDQKAIGALISILEDANSDVRQEAAGSIISIGIDSFNEFKKYKREKGNNYSDMLISFMRQGNNLADLIIKASDILDIYIFSKRYEEIISFRVPGSEQILILALQNYGDESMANVFLNRGNPELFKAAKEWAQKRGYVVKKYNSSSGPMFGTVVD